MIDWLLVSQWNSILLLDIVCHFAELLLFFLNCIFQDVTDVVVVVVVVVDEDGIVDV